MLMSEFMLLLLLKISQLVNSLPDSFPVMGHSRQVTNVGLCVTFNILLQSELLSLDLFKHS